MSILNPEPRTLTPLPPSPRDFEIHRLHLVHHMSTRRLADKYQISQTRIRQIVKAVNEWLAATLPAKTEVEQEQETRLAQHIAADQLQRQLEVLQNYFDGSGDPKYSRQQTRVILALARLGILPGSIDSLAADAEHKPEAPARDSVPERTAATTDTPPQSATLHPSSFHLHPSSPPPPSRDFSPITASDHSENSTHESDGITTPLHEVPSRKIELPLDEALTGLLSMENRLLTLIDETAPNDRERLESLNYSLANIRRQKATLELRLSPNRPGATITTNDPPTNHSPTHDLLLSDCQPTTAP